MKYKNLIIKKGNIIYLSDPHFGVRSASEEWQTNIKKYFYEWFIPLIKKQIKKYNGDICLVILGDIFDDRKNINISVNDLINEIFLELSKLLPVYIINGNHDLYKKTNKGISSLTPLKNIPNITLINEPTEIIFEYNGGSSRVIAIPYLGNFADENLCLIEHKDYDYAWMHTDITKMKYDNGQEVVSGVNVDEFAGNIFSGHIHKRQTSGNVTYVGSPYQLTRGDIGNQKGIYVHTLNDGKTHFTKNMFSPIFQRVLIEDFEAFTNEEKLNFIANNYTDIIVTNKKKKYNFKEIYDLSSNSQAKRLSILYNIKDESETALISDEDLRDISIEELVDKIIEKEETLDDKGKERLKILSKSYIKAVEDEINSL